MTIHYNDNAARFIRARRLDNKSYEQIKKDMEITYPEYSRQDVSTIRRNYLTWCAYNDLEDTGVTRKHVDRWVPRKIKEGDRYFFCDKDNKQNDPRRASLLHLLDLKRAGHSPTRTELALASSPAIEVPKQTVQTPPVSPPPPPPVQETIYKNDTPDELENASYRKVFRTPIKQIIACVSRQTGVSEANIMEDRRSPEYVIARHMVYWLAIEAGYSYAGAGRALNRDHTTVLSGYARFDEHIKKGDKYKHVNEPEQYAHTAHFLRSTLIEAKPVAYWGA